MKHSILLFFIQITSKIKIANIQVVNIYRLKHRKSMRWTLKKNIRESYNKTKDYNTLTSHIVVSFWDNTVDTKKLDNN